MPIASVAIWKRWSTQNAHTRTEVTNLILVCAGVTRSHAVGQAHETMLQLKLKLRYSVAHRGKDGAGMTILQLPHHAAVI